MENTLILANIANMNGYVEGSMHMPRCGPHLRDPKANAKIPVHNIPIAYTPDPYEAIPAIS
jgi:hypothetical protein